MRMYLSSFGLGDRPDALVALTGKARRCALIVNALDHRPEARAVWLKKQTESLTDLGYAVSELDFREYFGAEARLAEQMKTIDVVWINGGNSFVLRRAMKQCGFDTLIRAALARDEVVYGGFSAAAVIAYRSMRGLEITDDPIEVPAGYHADVVWDGLGLLPFALAVHFKSDHSETESTNREIAFYEENGIPYRTLRDGEALVIRGGSQEIVGSPHEP